MAVKNQGPICRCHNWASRILAGWLCTLSPVVAGDWPQILGPNRNGIATDEQLPNQLASQPQTLKT